MKKMNYVYLLLIPAGCILVSLIWLCVRIYVVSGAFSIFMPSPPKPQITFSEFNYKVDYVIGEQKYSKDGVITCNYEGVESLGTAGKYRKWSLVTSDNKDRIVLWDVSDMELNTPNGDKITEFYLDVGYGNYYMNDDSDRYNHGVIDGYISYKYVHPQHNIIVQGKIKNDEAAEKYGIYILSYEIDPPISNSFG